MKEVYTVAASKFHWHILDADSQPIYDCASLKEAREAVLRSQERRKAAVTVFPVGTLIISGHREMVAVESYAIE